MIGSSISFETLKKAKPMQDFFRTTAGSGEHYLKTKNHVPFFMLNVSVQTDPRLVSNSLLRVITQWKDSSQMASSTLYRRDSADKFNKSVDICEGGVGVLTSYRLSHSLLEQLNVRVSVSTFTEPEHKCNIRRGNFFFFSYGKEAFS